MPFIIDNQTAIIAVIVLIVAHIIVYKYVIQRTFEHEIQKNNKRVIKKMSEQISTTFRQYTDVGMHDEKKHAVKLGEIQHDDSVDDPLNDGNTE